MLSLRTRDTWTDAHITLDDGGGAQTYTLVATDVSAYDAMESLVAWADTNVPAIQPFTWTWAANSADDGATVSISANGSFTLVANSAAQTLLGFNASYSSAATHEGANSAQGTWAPAAKIGVRNYYRHDDTGSASGAAGACRGGVPGTASYIANVATVCDTAAIARLAGELVDADYNRVGWVYQEHKTAWRRIAVGGVSYSRAGGTLFRVDIEARGIA